MSDLKWPRVLLKLSGEAFAGERDGGIDPQVVASTAQCISEVVDNGVQVGVVVGGGNFVRGQELAAQGVDRTTADHMGMLGTTMNALALQSALENLGTPARTQSAIGLNEVAEPYIRRRAIRHLEKGRVVIFASGSGNPYFSTDTASLLRAAEIEATVVLMAKNGVDGVYDCDPATNPDAVHLPHLSPIEVVQRGLKVADLTAMTFASDNKLPIMVFNISDPRNIIRILIDGEDIGTLITH